MADLEIYFLGDYKLIWHGEVLPVLSTRKARALFAYLVTYRRQTHPRARLAGLFWGDYPEARAQRNLNTTLWRIRQVVPEGYLIADGESIGFDTDSSYWLDVEAFLACSAQTDLSNLDAILELEQATNLYQGDFLAGQYLDWALVEVEHLRSIYLQTLDHLVTHFTRVDAHKALLYARRYLDVDPLREDLHRQVISILFQTGQQSAALKQYQDCCSILQSELGIEPSSETQELFEKMRQIPTQKDQLSFVPEIIEEPKAIYENPFQSETPFKLVGRHDERAHLLQHLDDLQDQFGCLVYLEGEAGVGKTRLVEDIAEGAEWRGLPVVWGYCRPQPYAPVVDILQNCLTPLRLKQISRLLDPSVLAAIAQLIPQLREDIDLPDLIPLDQEAARLRLHLAIVDLLKALVGLAPCLFIIEDWHWMDNATLTLLPDLAACAGSCHLLIIGTGRSAEVRDREALWSTILEMDRQQILERLSLTRLTVDEFSIFVESIFGDSQFPQALVSQIFHKTLGNPLFTVETLRSLVETGRLFIDADGSWRFDAQEAIHLPEAAQSVLLNRLDSLEPTERHMIALAAVIGIDQDYDLWRDALDCSDDDFLASNSELLQRQFIAETSQGYRFTHALIRDAAYEAIPIDSRRQLHRQVGEALETIDPQADDQLGYHFHQAGVWEKALWYGCRAGERAAQIYAADAALEHYDRALDALAHLPEDTTQHADFRLKLLLGREAAYRFLGNQEQRLGDLHTLLEMVDDIDDPGLRAGIYLRQAEYWVDVSEHRRAYDVASQALELSDVLRDPVLQADILASLGSASYTLGDYAEAYGYFLEARDLYLENDRTNRTGQMIAAMGLACIPLARFLEARDCNDDALQIFRQTGHKKGQIRVLNNLGMLHGHAGLYRQALDYFGEGVEICRQINDIREVANLQRALAVVCVEIGAYEDADTCLDEALRICHEIGWRRMEGLSLVTLGDLRYNQGRYEQAIEIHQQALELNEDLGLNHFLFRSHMTLTRVYLAMGNHAFQAMEHAQETMRASQVEGLTNDYIYAHAIMGQALLVAGRKAEALEYSQKAMTRFERDGYVEEAEEEIIYYHFQVLSALGKEYEAHDHITHANNRIQQKALLLGGKEADQFTTRPALNQAIAAEYARRDGLQPGQCRFQLSSGEEIIWTIDAGESDAQIASKQGKVALRQTRLKRLLQEARQQNTDPTQADLAGALGVSRRTIRKDLRNI